MKGYTFDPNTIRYSYDDAKDAYDFHIVPKYTTDYYEAIYKKFRKGLIDILKEKYDVDDIIIDRGGFGSKEYTKMHMWLEIKWNAFSYLIGFQSLYCDENKISCELGRIQFSAFAACYNGPNFDKKGNFKMMYPTSSGTETYDKETHHRVYNTNYYVQFDENDQIIDAIIGDFVLFINQTEDLRTMNNHILKKEQTPSCVTPTSSSL